MKYYAKVISLSDNIEEEVLLSLGEKELCCFIDSAPYKLVEGCVYLIDLNLSFVDDESMVESEDKKISIKRIDDGFSYEIVGFVSENKLITDGVIFDDELLLDYVYLDSNYVKVTPDRIGVSFL
ncbi:hypothetical protein [Serratia rubidaea]|uniref:hypothetical protein n=1 Tax=Serratia rubidaea TaxID=61652 RepID=UPI0006C767B6|nr:hypothetical protein [Serratia rubidaea]QPR65467.1 hypothetical protein I6G83_09695 [Serratia rubidaea]HAY0637461.1 hypothetical protein [Serratia rubidaea]